METITVPVAMSRRLLAYVIDLLILEFTLFLPFALFFGDRIPQTFSNMNANEPLLNAIGFFLLLNMLLYFTFFDYLLGTTPGKMLFSLRVDQELTLGKAFLRNLGYIPLSLFQLLLLVDLGFLIVNRKQRFLEWTSKTTTVYEVKAEY